MKLNLNSLLKYLPLLAPIPEGYAVGLAIARELEWHWSIVVIASVIVAGTGFWGVQVYNRMSEFNATLSKDEIKEGLRAPNRNTLIVLGIWFIGVAALTVLLDIYPILRALTPLGLVVIGFSAAYLFSLSNIQSEREQARASYRVDKRKEKEDARNLKQKERKEKKEHAQVLATIRQQISARTNAAQVSQGSSVEVVTPRRAKSGSKLSDETLLFYWAVNPYLTDSEMAARLARSTKDPDEPGEGITVSRQAIGQRRAAMIKRGIIRQDPDGRVVELIGQGEEPPPT